MLSDNGLCDGLITRPEDSCRLWCVVCDLKTSRISRPRPASGRRTTGKKYLYSFDFIFCVNHCESVIPSTTLIHGNVSGCSVVGFIVDSIIETHYYRLYVSKN
jgi:hypothetical protein